MTADPTPHTHEDAVELLEDYVDGRLAPDDAARLETHVAGCEECTAILDAVDPIDLAVPAPALDERSMRRSVRRTLLGVAARAAAMLLVLLVLLVFGSQLLVQPLLLGGERSAALARATHELPALVHPGAAVEKFRIDAGAQTRTFTTDLHMPVGSTTVDLGTVTSQRRLIGSDTPLWPFVDDIEPNPAPARDVLERLGRTSVATVAVQLPSPLPVEDAQVLTDDLDVSTVWAGFDIASITNGLASTDSLAMLGASTCGVSTLSDELFAATSASAGSSFGAAPTSIGSALDVVRDAVANTAANPSLATLLPETWFETLAAAADAMATDDPTVSLLVITGPSDQLVDAIDTIEALDARVLATATYNWVRPLCG